MRLCEGNRGGRPPGTRIHSKYNVFNLHRLYFFQWTRMDVNQGGYRKVTALPVRMHLASRSGARRCPFRTRSRAHIQRSACFVYTRFFGCEYGVASTICTSPRPGEWLGHVHSAFQAHWTGRQRKKVEVQVRKKKFCSSACIFTQPIGFVPANRGARGGRRATRPLGR